MLFWNVTQYVSNAPETRATFFVRNEYNISRCFLYILMCTLCILTTHLNITYGIPHIYNTTYVQTGIYSDTIMNRDYTYVYTIYAAR